MITSKKNFLINVSTYQHLIFLLCFLLLVPVAGNAEWSATVPNPIIEYHYTYDNNGNITKIEDKIHGTGYNQSFTYDEVDRLSSAIGPYGVNNTQATQTYSYNEIGDPTDIPLPVTNPNENGNVTDYNGKHIDYDYENRPVKITNSNNNTVTEFSYDYSGQRVYTKVSSGTITSEDYYVGNIYEESYSVDSSSPVISASTTTVTYVYAGSIRVAGLTTQTTATGTENNTLYYHGDHLGSSSIITDGTGTVVRNISYQPWGNVQSNTEESGASTLDPNHKFTGQILDDSTDLYYYGARYYDPTIRRFITPDTIVQSPYDPQSLNRYAYVRNNPLIYVDPSGHWRLDNFLVSTLQVASYASMFAGFSPGAAMMFAAGSSMAQAGLQGGHFDDAMNASTIGMIASGIGQGVAQGIGDFGGPLLQGAGAGFASGGAGAIMSGQSGANAWKAAYQGAAMGAATAGVMWGITQGNSEIALYRETVNSYRQAKATKSLDISQYPMYAAAIESNFGVSLACVDFSLFNTSFESNARLSEYEGLLTGKNPRSGYSTSLLGAGAEFSITTSYTGPTITHHIGFGRWLGASLVTRINSNGMSVPIGIGFSLGLSLDNKILPIFNTYGVSYSK